MNNERNIITDKLVVAEKIKTFWGKCLNELKIELDK